jgi:predicted DNA-binding transcriptional regulator YafY
LTLTVRVRVITYPRVVRSSRLLAILIHLEATGPSTAGEIAALTEVSLRTAYRDIAALQAAGVPLWTEVGPHGGVRLLDGWHSGLDGLSADEAGILVLSGVPGAASELGLGSVLQSAEVKLLAGLAPDGRGRATQVRDRFHLDVPGWFEHKEPTPHLARVAQALWRDRRLDLRYQLGGRGPDGVAPTFRRRVDPLGLVLKAGTWYLVARHRSGVRSYRVGRIRSASVRSETFERPVDFDLGAWWRASGAAFDRAMLRSSFTVRLSPTGVAHLPGVMPSAVIPEVLAAAGPPAEDGWITVTIPVERDDIGAHQLLALAGEVEVLSPPGARERLAAAGQAMAALHR